MGRKSHVMLGAAVAVTMVLFAPSAQFIPKAALAGILMLSAWRMVQWRELVDTMRRAARPIVWIKTQLRPDFADSGLAESWLEPRRSAAGAFLTEGSWGAGGQVVRFQQLVEAAKGERERAEQPVTADA